MMAADLSCRIGWLSQNDVDRVKAILEAADLPLYPPQEMSPDQFKQLMSVDKKVLDGQLRLILLKSIGSAVVTSDFSIEKLNETLEAGTNLGSCC